MQRAEEPESNGPPGNRSDAGYRRELDRLGTRPLLTPDEGEAGEDISEDGERQPNHRRHRDHGCAPARRFGLRALCSALPARIGWACGE